jgi:hypothetical protein
MHRAEEFSDLAGELFQNPKLCPRRKKKKSDETEAADGDKYFEDFFQHWIQLFFASLTANIFAGRRAAASEGWLRPQREHLINTGL